MITERQAEQITETLCSVAVRMDDYRRAPDALRTIRRALVDEIDELNRLKGRGVLVMNPDELKEALRAIGLALNATHNTVATDVVYVKPDETNSWRVDHSKELALLDALKATLLGEKTCLDEIGVIRQRLGVLLATPEDELIDAVYQFALWRIDEQARLPLADCRAESEFPAGPRDTLVETRRRLVQVMEAGDAELVNAARAFANWASQSLYWDESLKPVAHCTLASNAR